MSRRHPFPPPNGEEKDVECREVREYLPSYLEEEGPRPRYQMVIEHLKGCAGCTEELNFYRSLAGGLSSLSERSSDVPTWLLDSIVNAVRRRVANLARIETQRRLLSDPKVLAAGAVVAAGVAGAIFLRSGRRRSRRTVTGRLRTALSQA